MREFCTSGPFANSNHKKQKKYEPKKKNNNTNIDDMILYAIFAPLQNNGRVKERELKKKQH